MKEQHTQTIDGCEVLVTLFDYDEAADLSFELASKVAPIATSLASNANLTVDIAAVPMLSAIAQTIDAKAWGILLRRLLARVVVTGPFGEGGEMQRLELHKPADRNAAFRGRVMLTYKIAWFVMQVNFQDFFGLLQGTFGQSQVAEKA